MTLAATIERSKRDTESWKYTNLETLLAAATTRTASNANNIEPAHGDNARLVFINGVFQPEKSKFGSIPSCILMGDAETGYKLTLGEHTCLVAQPVELVFTADENAQPRLRQPEALAEGLAQSSRAQQKVPKEITVKLAIEIGANGRLTLLERHHASSAITILESNITLHERAKFVHGKIIAGGAHIATTKASVAKGAYYNNFSLVRGAAPVRNEIDVELQGEEAQAALNGAMLLRASEHADTTTRIAHNAPNCASRQIYKTVLADKSRGVFQGKIYVAPDAQKTDGYQLSRALLLSDQAEMDAKPELEIYTDDVKCSHGSTIGDLDDNAMFYLRARGLNEVEARSLLIEAFVGEIFDEIQVEEWRDIFRAEMEGWQG